MGALLLFITAVLATLVLYFWARKAQLEKQLSEEREADDAKHIPIRLDLFLKFGAAKAFLA